MISDEMLATGAVIVGRRTFDLADRWNGDHHGVPIFVPTRGEPPEPPSDLVHYVSDGVESAVRRAKEAAGEADRDGARSGPRSVAACAPTRSTSSRSTSSRSCWAKVGRLFEHLGADHIELELTRVIDAPGVTHPRYRVRQSTATRLAASSTSASASSMISPSGPRT